ncbi:unnamed protein product, partial [Prorocentrum cordatum]
GTLRSHHNFLQRAAFTTSTKYLPDRKEILRRLFFEDDRTQGSEVEALENLEAFVALARPVVRFCLQMDGEAPEPEHGDREAVEADDVDIAFGPLDAGESEEDQIPPEEVIQGSLALRR